VNITNIGTLTVNGILAYTGNSNLFIGGTGIQAGSGQDLVVRTVSAAQNCQFSTPILDNGGNAFVKSGASGKVTFDAANTYTGNTYINGGTLSLTANGSMANSSGLIIARGATLDLSVLGYWAIPGPLTCSGSGPGNSTAVRSVIQGAFGGNQTVIDLGVFPITLNYDGSPSPALQVNAGGLLNFNDNQITINNHSALRAGTYQLMIETNQISGSPNPVPNGTAINTALTTATVAVGPFGTNVVLTIVDKTRPTVTLTPSVVTYSGSPQGTTITAAPLGVWTVSNIKYNGSATVPTAPGVYAVTADFTPNDPDTYATLTGGAAGDFVINRVPTANDATYIRYAGVQQLNIPIANLLTNASDADGDDVSLVSVGTSTNGSTPVINGNYVVYNNPNNVADSFQYTVQDIYGATATANVIVNLSASSVFGQSSPSINTAGGPPTLTFAGIPGYNYSIQRADDVGFTVNVTTIQTTNAPAGGVFQFTDTTAIAPQSFYRLVWNP
jgi:autotransporter-associated beta strand protein